jgi:hypothetical protein
VTLYEFIYIMWLYIILCNIIYNIIIHSVGNPLLKDINETALSFSEKKTNLTNLSTASR